MPNSPPSNILPMRNRGEIWLTDLNPQQGTDLGKIRPVLIVQAQALLDAPTIPRHWRFRSPRTSLTMLNRSVCGSQPLPNCTTIPTCYWINSVPIQEGHLNYLSQSSPQLLSLILKPVALEESHTADCLTRDLFLGAAITCAKRAVPWRLQHLFFAPPLMHPEFQSPVVALSRTDAR